MNLKDFNFSFNSYKGTIVIEWEVLFALLEESFNSYKGTIVIRFGI